MFDSSRRGQAEQDVGGSGKRFHDNEECDRILPYVCGAVRPGQGFDAASHQHNHQHC